MKFACNSASILSFCITWPFENDVRCFLNIRNTVTGLFHADWIIKPAGCLMEIHFDLLFSSFTSGPPSFYVKLLILSGSRIWPRHLPQGGRLCLAWRWCPSLMICSSPRAAPSWIHKYTISKEERALLSELSASMEFIFYLNNLCSIYL